MRSSLVPSLCPTWLTYICRRLMCLTCHNRAQKHGVYVQLCLSTNTFVILYFRRFEDVIPYNIKNLLNALVTSRVCSIRPCRCFGNANPQTFFSRLYVCENCVSIYCLLCLLCINEKKNGSTKSTMDETIDAFIVHLETSFIHHNPTMCYLSALFSH